MKILYTKQINRASILKTIEKTIPIIRRFWGDQVTVCHGGVTQVNDDQQKSESIKFEDLMRKIENEEKTNPFIVGEWDFFILKCDNSEMIQLCHESDVHFQSQNLEMLKEIQAKLKEISIEYHEIVEQ
jgi:hypothetical protein